MRQKLYRFFFGDDIFISYSRSDAGKYATALAARMSELGYLCLLDQLGTDVNRNLPDSLREKVRRSTALVLIGTEGAASSRYVREEVNIFKESRRPIHPINVNDALSKEDWPELAGLSWISESRKRVEKGEPDPEAITQLRNSSRYRRRNQWLRLSLLLGFTFLALTVAVTVGASYVWVVGADVRRITAEMMGTRASEAAAQAEANADKASERERTAKADADRATVQAADAENRKWEAVGQQEVAEAGMRQAQLLERAAEESAAAATRQEEGSRAALIAREPGMEFKALALALKAARPEFEVAGVPAEQVVRGLITSVNEVDYSLPLKGIPGEIHFARISPDGRKVFAQIYDGDRAVTDWVLWDVQTGKSETIPRDTKHDANYVSFSRNGQRLLIIDTFTSAQIWDLRDRPPRPVKTECVTPQSRFTTAALDGDGRRLLTLSGWEATLCEIAPGEKTDGKRTELSFPSELKGTLSNDTAFTKQGEPAVYGVWWSLTEKNPCVSHGNGALYYLEAKKANKKSNRCVEVKTPGRYFSGIGDDGSIITFGEALDLGSQSQSFTGVRVQSPRGDVQMLSGYKGKIFSAAFFDRRARVLTVSEGRYARLADARTHPAYAALRGHRGSISHVLFSPDGKLILTAGKDETARVWDALTGSLLSTLRLSGQAPPGDSALKSSAVSNAVFSPDGTRVAMAVDGTRLQTWDALTGHANCPAPARGSIRAVSFFRGNNYVITAPAQGEEPLTIWDAYTCRAVTTVFLEDKDAALGSIVSFSPDGTSTLTYSNRIAFMVKQWDLKGIDLQSETPIILKGIDLGVLPLGLARSILPGGILGITVDDDHSLEIWRPRRKSNIPLEGLPDAVDFVFSADATRVAATALGGVGVWDARSGKFLMTVPLRPDATATTPIALSPDGSRVVIVSADGTARIYPTSAEGYFEVATRLIGRQYRGPHQ